MAFRAGSAAPAGPPPGAVYPSLLRGDSYAPERSLIGVFLAPILWLVIGGFVGSLVLAAAWRIGPRELAEADYMAAARRFEFWEGMLAAHLQIAVMIPICFLLVRYWHSVRPGVLWSVQERPRWGYLAVCVAVAVVVFGGQVTVMGLSGGVGWQPQPGFVAFLVVILLTAPVQAVAEEVLFRGYLLQALGSMVARPWFGVVASALLFALFHGVQNVPLFLSRFAFGLLFGFLVLRTGGLEAAIAAHVVNNVFAFTLAALTSTVATSRTLTAVGWGQAFGGIAAYAIIAVVAAGIAVWAKVPSRASQVDRAAAQ